MMNLMRENIRFCVISTRMEDSLAMSPLMDELERHNLDSAFVDWFESSSVHSSSPRAQTREMPGVTVLRNVMRWRYLLSRVILHRPVLLWYAMRRMPFDDLADDKKTAVDTCRDVTADLINDIGTTWKGQKECQMSGWNATWLLYQAVMVPVLSLFCDTLDSEVVERSRHQVESALETFSQLQRWSSTAKRSYEVVSRIYEASRRHTDTIPDLQPDYYDNIHHAASGLRPQYIDLTSHPHIPHHQNQSQHSQLQFNGMNNLDFLATPTKELYMDNMFDSLNWSTGLPNEYRFESPSLGGWDFQALGANGWTGTEFEGYFNPTFCPEEQGSMDGSSNGMEYVHSPMEPQQLHHSQHIPYQEQQHQLQSRGQQQQHQQRRYEGVTSYSY
jgi:hypothetical protein